MTLHEQYVVDREGKRQAVLVPLAEWEAILEALEDLTDLSAYDEAKAEDSDTSPFEQAVAEIREGDLD